jgi:hypothetical protein
MEVCELTLLPVLTTVEQQQNLVGARSERKLEMKVSALAKNRFFRAVAPVASRHSLVVIDLLDRGTRTRGLHLD